MGNFWCVVWKRRGFAFAEGERCAGMSAAVCVGCAPSQRAQNLPHHDPVPSCHLRAGSAGERLPRPQRTQGTGPAVTQGIFVSICVHLNNFQSGGWSSPCPKAALNSGGHLGGFTGTVACPGTGAVLPAAVRSLGALPNRARDVDQEPLSSPPRGRELCWWLRSPIPVFSPIFPPLRSACAVRIPPSAL